MFRTLLILLWQKKREREIPPHKYVCLSQEAVRWHHKTANQVYRTAASTRWWEKERKAAPIFFSPTSLTWDAITSLEPGQAWVPLLNWGWRTQPGRVPLFGPSQGLLSPTFWLGPESHVASRPQGIWKQGSASLNLSWCWGSQLKPCCSECSLLAPSAVYCGPGKMSQGGLFVWCFRGKITETQETQVLSG